MAYSFRILFSLLVIIFCFLALGDILSGSESLIISFLILGLSALWFGYLIKPFKAPKFITFFLIFLASVVLHNFASRFLQTEECFFFSLALLSLLASIIFCLVFIFKRAKNLIKKRKK